MLKEFLKKEGILFREDIDTSKLLTIKASQNIRLVIDLKTLDNLIKVVSFLNRNNLNFKVIGGGSNLLITEKCEEIPILKLSGEFNAFNRISENSYDVFAGTSLMNFCRKLVDQELSGLEFAAGIPATLGGAVAMNAGAHGSEMANVIETIYGIDRKGQKIKININDLKPTYRTMNLPNEIIIYACKIKLTKSNGLKIKEEMQKLLEYRKKTQPLHLPSCGSVFKNIQNKDKTRYAGEIIQSLGLKGIAIGNAKFSALHANWIVNPNKKATANEVLELINLAKQKAFKEYKLNLIPEVQIW